MEKKSLSSSPHKGGVFRKILMPGFSDAGAATTYVPGATIPRRTTVGKESVSTSTTLTSASTPLTSTSTSADIPTINGTTFSNVLDNSDGHNKESTNDKDVDTEDTFSESATELHDNRTNNHIQSLAPRSDRHHLLRSNVIQDTRTAGGEARDANIPSAKNKIKDNDHGNYNVSDESIEVEATYGFFPSTKPPPSPSPHRTTKAVGWGDWTDSGNESFSSTPKKSCKNSTNPPNESPRPISPPIVTRKQLVAMERSSSTAAVVEDEIAVTSSIAPTTGKIQHESTGSWKDERHTPSQLQKDEEDLEIDRTYHLHDTPQQDEVHARPLFMKQELKREVSTFSLAPEIGVVVDREGHRAELKRWKEREDELNQRQTQCIQGTKKEFPAIEEETIAEHKQNQPQAIKESKDVTIEMEDHQLSNDTVDFPDDYNETGNNKSNINRRLDKNALQEMDRIEEQQEIEDFQSFSNIVNREIKNKSKARQIKKGHDQTTDKNTATNSENNDEGNDESSSIVSSTCSEFGTVIQLSTLEERMAEVEEMESAALAEERTEEYDAQHPTGSATYRPLPYFMTLP